MVEMSNLREFPKYSKLKAFLVQRIKSLQLAHANCQEKRATVYPGLETINQVSQTIQDKAEDYQLM